MDGLTISEVARRAGVRPSTIRYYESINVLPAPERIGGRRMYDVSVLERLSFIQLTQRLGFTLAEIELLFQQRDADHSLPIIWRTLAQQKLADVEQLIQDALDVKRLLSHSIRCGCPTLEACMSCVQCTAKRNGDAEKCC